MAINLKAFRQQLDELIGRGDLVKLANTYAKKAAKKGPGQAHHENMRKAAYALAVGDKDKAKRFHRQAKAFPKGALATEGFLHERLSKDAKAGDWIREFLNSDAPQFEGKSKPKRIKMALAAYYKNQDESVVWPKADPSLMEGSLRVATHDPKAHEILKKHGIHSIDDYETAVGKIGGHPVEHDLYDHFSHEMPVGVAKARTGDPSDWIHKRIEKHFDGIDAFKEEHSPNLGVAIATPDQKLYSPNTKDEKDFIDMHKVAKVPDANGNKDDVFQATNVKTIGRKAERHGHEPTPEDEAEYKPSDKE